MSSIPRNRVDKLIQKIPRNSLRKFLYEKGIISKESMARSSKSAIVTKLAENDLVKEAIYLIIPGHYSWFKEVVRIINKDNYYDITIEAARGFVKKGQNLGQKSIDILIDFLLELEDFEIDINNRVYILNLIEIYCRQNGFTYQDLLFFINLIQ